MDLTEAIRLVAKRSGLHESADKTDITTAIVATMEEIGTNIEVRRAQKIENRTIDPGENSVLFPVEFQRILSVGYRYASGSDTIKNNLDKAEPSQFDEMNEGKQDVETDDFTHFMVSGRDIYVGPGVAKTGGTIIIRGQRPLGVNDIPDLPNTMLVVHGGVANLLPDVNPDGTINAAASAARRLFTMGIVPAALAAIPVQQAYDEVRLGRQMVEDDIYRGNL